MYTNTSRLYMLIDLFLMYTVTLSNSRTIFLGISYEELFLLVLSIVRYIKHSNISETTSCKNSYDSESKCTYNYLL